MAAVGDSGTSERAEEDEEAEEMSEGGSGQTDGGGEDEVNFDRSQAEAHLYLGDREDLGAGASPLPDRQQATVPLLPIQDLVLFPGEVLPLRLTSPVHQEVVRKAMRAAAPLKDLIAVVHIQQPSSSSPRLHSTGCTALIRQIRESEHGTLSCIAWGHQRMRIHKLNEDPSMMQASVTVLEDIRVPRLPKAMGEGATFWGRWVYRPFDPDLLAAQAKALVSLALPKVASFKGNPLQMSFWLAANLPLQLDTKQSLLCASNEVERLRMLVAAIHHLQLSKMKCRACRQKVGSSQDIFCMQESGPAGAFVNEHGFVHDMVTITRIHRAGIELQGEPEAGFSWFPGYAWTIFVCSCCGNHLGWRFTATTDELRPRVFWGIRVSGLLAAD